MNTKINNRKKIDDNIDYVFILRSGYIDEILKDVIIADKDDKGYFVAYNAEKINSVLKEKQSLGVKNIYVLKIRRSVLLTEGIRIVTTASGEYHLYTNSAGLPRDSAAVFTRVKDI